MNTAEIGEASSWVKRFLGSVPDGGQVLDVACGSGRNISAALKHGLNVTAIDRSIEKAKAHFAASPSVNLIQLDLETGQPLGEAIPAGRFSAVIVTNYLWRPILPDIVAAVAPNGLLIYETFGVGNERFGKPSNPDFLLRPGELLEAVQGKLTPFFYENAELKQPERIVQRICAAGAHHEWLSTPPVNTVEPAPN